MAFEEFEHLGLGDDARAAVFQRAGRLLVHPHVVTVVPEREAGEQAAHRSAGDEDAIGVRFGGTVRSRWLRVSCHRIECRRTSFARIFYRTDGEKSVVSGIGHHAGVGYRRGRHRGVSEKGVGDREPVDGEMRVPSTFPGSDGRSTGRDCREPAGTPLLPRGAVSGRTVPSPPLLSVRLSVAYIDVTE